MAIFVCPSCGYTGAPPEVEPGKIPKCKKCGHVVDLGSQGGQRRRPIPAKKKKKSKTPLIAGAGLLGLAAAVALFVSMGDSKPVKVQLSELNKDVIDIDILRVGITALEDKGWSEADTAFYIETRIADYKALNEAAREQSRSGGGNLSLKSSEADFTGLGNSSLRESFAEITQREDQVKEFERILADYKASQ